MYHGCVTHAIMLRSEQRDLSGAIRRFAALTKSNPWLILIIKTSPFWNPSRPNTTCIWTALVYWSLCTDEAEETDITNGSFGFLRQNHTFFFSSFLLFHSCPGNHLCPLIEPQAHVFSLSALPMVKVIGKSSPRVHSA